MISRRQFLKLGLATGAGLLLPVGCDRLPFLEGASHEPLEADHLTKFVDPLPFPISVLQPAGKVEGDDYYEVAMTQFKQKLHRDLPPTTVWGYSGQYPGKTIEVRSNQRIFVKWINDLSADAYLIPGAFDPNLHGTNMHEPEVKTVVHLHGAHVPPEGDGHPEAWFTRNFAKTGPAFTTQVYEYPNRQQATTLWYHDHALGQTRLNVYAGLAGFYLIRSPEEEALNLPKGDFEVPLVIQDRLFAADGALLYPTRDPKEIPTGADHPGPWMPEFFGEVILVNGKVWPYLEVEPRKYRFRILNGSNARFYHLKLSSGLTFHQVGSDQGFLPSPAERDSLLLAPAERADVIVDFSGHPGQTILMANDANAPFPDGDPPEAETAGQVMLFKVKASASAADTSLLPAQLSPVTRLAQDSASAVRVMALKEYLDADDNPITVLLNGKKWDEPISDKPQLGAVEIWNLINTTVDAHPIHLHLVKFQVLDRRELDAEAYKAAWGAVTPGEGPAPIPAEPFLKGERIPPGADEAGWKDTVRVNPGQVTRIIARFDDYLGEYPWHCHILEHEDNEMMLRFQVIPGA